MILNISYIIIYFHYFEYNKFWIFILAYIKVFILIYKLNKFLFDIC